jgi:hypothetical protein
MVPTNKKRSSQQRRDRTKGQNEGDKMNQPQARGSDAIYRKVKNRNNKRKPQQKNE